MILPSQMGYALRIGFRYLRSKKRSTISVITFIAVSGVALGVAALLTVLSITSGFQDAFRDKVLGVNAHVLVLKYGLDFNEYRRVIQMSEDMPEVAGAGPFLINEMMLAKGDRLSGVLVKGVDPERMPTVLDLPKQIIAGSIEGLRVRGMGPLRPEDLESAGLDNELDRFLDDLIEREGERGEPGTLEGIDGPSDAELLRRIRDGENVLEDNEVPEVVPEPAAPQEGDGPEPEGELDYEPLPTVDVPSPDAIMDLLNEEGFDPQLPGDDAESEAFAEPEVDPSDRELLPGIIVGASLARTLELAVGDRVKVVSPLTGLDISMVSGSRTPTPRSADFRVTGIFEAGFQEYDTRLVYVDLFEAQRFYRNGDNVTGVEIRLHDLDKAAEIATGLEERLGPGPYHTLGWAKLNEKLFAALQNQKLMLSIVIGTIIFVAAFNVVATLIMVVLEKKREIAILKAMGATDSAILTIFMVQGVVIGCIGTFLGLLIGGLVVWYLQTYEFALDPKVYLIDHLPVRVSEAEFIITAITAFLISSLATVVPSWWAARMLPVDGFRGH